MGNPRNDQDLDGGGVTFEDPEPDHFDQLDDKNQDHLPKEPKRDDEDEKRP